MISRKTFGLTAVGALALGMMGVVGYVAQDRASGEGRGAALANSLPKRGDLTEAAAIVNGNPIPRFQFDTTVALADGVANGLSLGGNPSPAPSKTEILDGIINAELKFQEATRTGIAASDAEVEAAIAQSRNGMDDPANAHAREFLKTYLSRTGESYADYWKDPRFHEVVRKNLIIGKFDDSFRPTGGDPQAGYRAIKAKTAELRAKADIKILVRLD